MNDSDPLGASPAPTALTAADRDLVTACLAGAPGAWDAFLARFAGLLAHVVTRTAARRGLALSPHDRDDLVAETILACLRDNAAVLRRFAGRASLPTYLTVIARRVAVRALRRRHAAGVPAAAASPAESPAPGDQVARFADREEVERLLARLDERDALLLRLHHLQGLSYGEIARVTNMPLGSIGPALSRAKARLRGLRDAG